MQWAVLPLLTQYTSANRIVMSVHQLSYEIRIHAAGKPEQQTEQ